MNAVPLTDALPPWWDRIITNHNHERHSFIPIILINDTIETDARFLLYTLSSQYLASTTQTSSTFTDKNLSQSNKRRVFWISAGVATERQVLTSLKKIGFDATNVNVAKGMARITTGITNSERIKVIPIALELASQIMSTDSAADNESIDKSRYLKNLYRRFRSWIESNESEHQQDSEATETSETLIIIDEISTMKQMFGSSLVLCFIQKLKNTLSKSGCGGVVAIRSRIDLSVHNIELLDFKSQQQQSSIKNVTGSQNHYFYDFSTSSAWMGAGGGNQISLEHKFNSQFPEDRQLDQSLLLEMAHGIIDALPLASGFAREVHGRLVFTDRFSGDFAWYKMKNGGGNDKELKNRRNINSSFSRTRVGRFHKKQNQSNETGVAIVNYFCTDQGVKVIRLRS